MPNVSLTRKPTEFSPPPKSWGGALEIGLFIILSILLYIYLISPKQSEYTERKDKLESLVNDEARIDRQKKSFDGLVRELRENSALVKQLDEVVPLDAKASSIYVLTEYLTQSAGMTSSSIAVDTDPDSIASGNKAVLKDAYGVDRQLFTIPVTVNAIGSMDQLINFLGQVENSNRLLDVSSVDISQGKDSQFIFKLRLDAYAFSSVDKKGSAKATGSTAPPAVTSPQ